jgi:uncharacterized membrane protein
VVAAEVTVCNKFAQAVSIAVGYQTPSDFKTEGWWVIQPVSCTVVDTRPVTTPYYIHAHTQWRETGGGARERHAWGKGKRLVVASEKFTYVRADQIAAGDQDEEFTLVSDGRFRKVLYTIQNATQTETTQGN